MYNISLSRVSVSYVRAMYICQLNSRENMRAALCEYNALYHCHYLLQYRMLRMFSAHLFLGGSLCHQTLCLIEVGSSNTEHYSVARHLWIEISLNINNHIRNLQFLISYTGIHTNTHTRKHYWTLKAMLTGVCCVRVRVRVR